MVYVYPENMDPTDFGMGPRGLNPALTVLRALLQHVHYKYRQTITSKHNKC